MGELSSWLLLLVLPYPYALIRIHVTMVTIVCCCFHSIGGESLAVAQNAYAVLWFKGRELNMVFGILLSISRVVSCYYHQVILFLYWLIITSRFFPSLVPLTLFSVLFS